MGTLKLYVVDKRNTKALGVVNIELTQHITKHIDFQNPKALKNIHDVFCVHKVTSAVASTMFSQKVGELEISLTNVFRNQIEHNRDEPIRESSPNIIDRSAIIQTITESQARIGGKSVKIVDPKNYRYQDPFSREVERRNMGKEPMPDLSNILNFAENVLNDIDREYNKKSADYEIKDIIDNYNRGGNKERQDPEIELQMLRLKRYDPKNDQKIEASIINERQNVVTNNLSLNRLNEPGTLFIHIEDLVVNSQNFSKLLNEDICTLEVSLKSSEGTQKDVHKFFIKSSSKLKIFQIDKTVAFDLKFPDSKSLQDFLNSSIQFKLLQRKSLEKGKSVQVAISEVSLSAFDCLNQVGNEGIMKTITFQISEKRSKTPVRANPANLKKISKESSFGDLNIHIRKGSPYHNTPVNIISDKKSEHKLGIVVYMNEIRNIQLTGNYISVSTGGLDQKPSKQAINIVEADENNLYVDYTKLIHIESITDKPLVFKFFTKRNENNNEEVLGFCSLPLYIDKSTFVEAKDECFVIENGLFEVIDIMKQPKFFVYLKVFVGNAAAALRLYNDLCNNQNPNTVSQKGSKTVFPSTAREVQRGKELQTSKDEYGPSMKKMMGLDDDNMHPHPIKRPNRLNNYDRDETNLDNNGSHPMIKQSAIDKLRQIFNTNPSKFSDNNNLVLKSQKDLERLSSVFEVQKVYNKEYSRSSSDLKQLNQKIKSEPVASLVASGFTRVKNNLVTDNGTELIVNKLESDREISETPRSKDEGTFSYYMQQFKIHTGGQKPKFETFAPNKPSISESELAKINLPLTILEDDYIIEDPLRLLIRFFDMLIKIDSDLIQNLDVDYLTYQDFLALIQQYDINLVIEEVDLILNVFDFRHDMTISKNLIHGALKSYLDLRTSYITKTIMEHHQALSESYGEIKKQLLMKIDQLNGRTQSSYLSKNFSKRDSKISITVEDIYSKLIFGYDKSVTDNNLTNFLKTLDCLPDVISEITEFQNNLKWLLSREPIIELQPSFSEFDVKDYYKKKLNNKNLEKALYNYEKNINLTGLLTVLDDSQTKTHESINVYCATSLFYNILNYKGDVSFRIHSTIPGISIKPYVGVDYNSDYDEIIPYLKPHEPAKRSNFKNKNDSRIENSVDNYENEETIKEDGTILSDNRSVSSYMHNRDQSYQEKSQFSHAQTIINNNLEDKDMRHQKNVEDVMMKRKKQSTDFKPLAKYSLSIKLDKYELGEDTIDKLIGKRIAFRYKLFGSNKNYETVMIEVNSSDKFCSLDSKTLHVVYLDATIDHTNKIDEFLHDLEIQLMCYDNSGEQGTLAVACIPTARFNKECFIDEKVIMVTQGELLNSFGNNMGKLDLTINAHIEITKGPDVVLNRFEDVINDRNYPLNSYLTMRIARFERLESLFFIIDRLKSNSTDTLDSPESKNFKLIFTANNEFLPDLNACIYEGIFTDTKSLLSVLGMVQLQNMQKIAFKKILHHDYKSLSKMLRSAIDFKLSIEIRTNGPQGTNDRLLYATEIAKKQMLLKDCLPKINNDDNEILLTMEDSNFVTILKCLLLFNCLPYDQPIYPTAKKRDQSLLMSLKLVKIININDGAIELHGSKRQILAVYSNSGMLLAESKPFNLEVQKNHKMFLSTIDSDFIPFFTSHSQEALICKILDADRNKSIVETYKLYFNRSRSDFTIDAVTGYSSSSRVLLQCIFSPQENSDVEIARLNKISTILNNKIFSTVETFKSCYPYNFSYQVDDNIIGDKKNIDDFALAVEWHQFKIFLIDKFEIVKSEGELLKHNVKALRSGIVDIKKLVWSNSPASCENFDESLFKGCFNELRYYDEKVNGITGFISLDNFNEITSRYKIKIHDMNSVKPPLTIKDANSSNNTKLDIVDYLLVMGNLTTQEPQIAISFTNETPELQTIKPVKLLETTKVSPIINLDELERYENVKFSWRIKKIELRNIESIVKDKNQKPNVLVDLTSSQNDEERISARIQYRTLAPDWSDFMQHQHGNVSIKSWLEAERRVNIYFREFVNRINNSVVDELQLTIDFVLASFVNLESIIKSMRSSTKVSNVVVLTKNNVTAYLDIEWNFGETLNNESSSLDADLLNTIKTLGELRHHDHLDLRIQTSPRPNEADNLNELGINPDLINFITREIQTNAQENYTPRDIAGDLNSRFEDGNLRTKFSYQAPHKEEIDDVKIYGKERLVFDFDSERLMKSLRKTDDPAKSEVIGLSSHNYQMVKETIIEVNQNEIDNIVDNILNNKDKLGTNFGKNDEVPAKYVLTLEEPKHQHQEETFSYQHNYDQYIGAIVKIEETKVVEDTHKIKSHDKMPHEDENKYHDIDLLDLNADKTVSAKLKDEDFLDINIKPAPTNPLAKQNTIERVTDNHIHEIIDANIRELKKPAKYQMPSRDQIKVRKNEKRPPPVAKRPIDYGVNPDLNYSQSEDDIIEMQDSHTDIINNLPRDLFTEIEKTRLDRLLRDNRLQPDFFNFGSDSEVE